MHEKRALITGAGGYIGANLIPSLLSDGWNVHVLWREGSHKELLSSYEQLTHHTATEQVESLIAVLSEVTPDTVFHLASLFLADHQPSHTNALIESNLAYGIRLLEAMSRTGAKRLVNVGSAGQHFDDSPYSPISLSTAMKQGFEAIIQYFTECCGLGVVTLKLYDTYGPHDPRMKILAAFESAIISSQPLQMSSSEQLLSMLYIDDVVSALRRAEELTAEPGHRIFSAPATRAISLGELVRMYSEIRGHLVPVEWERRTRRGKSLAKLWSGGEPLPDWQAQVTIEHGLRRYIDALPPRN